MGLAVIMTLTAVLPEWQMDLKSTGHRKHLVRCSQQDSNILMLVKKAAFLRLTRFVAGEREVLSAGYDDVARMEMHRNYATAMDPVACLMDHARFSLVVLA